MVNPGRADGESPEHDQIVIGEPSSVVRLSCPLQTNVALDRRKHRVRFSCYSFAYLCVLCVERVKGRASRGLPWLKPLYDLGVPLTGMLK